MSSKSNFSNITAKRYALALYELSKENSELDRIETESKSIQELFQHSSEFRNLVKDPTNNKNKQMNAIKIRKLLLIFEKKKSCLKRNKQSEHSKQCRESGNAG